MVRLIHGDAFQLVLPAPHFGRSFLSSRRVIDGKLRTLDVDLLPSPAQHVTFLCVKREEEPDEEAAGMNSIASFMVQPKKKARANLFVKQGLEMVDTF